jgi:hypothetical protein
MNELSALQSLGLQLPSPAYIFGAIVFGLIGIAAFRYGRKWGHRPAVWIGVVLMVYPYAISSTWLMYALGVALCAGLFVARG